MEKIDLDGVTLHRWSSGSSTYLVMLNRGHYELELHGGWIGPGCDPLARKQGL